MQYFKIEITILPTGEIVEKVILGSGSDCTKVTEQLNEAMDNTQATQFLPEYFLEDDDQFLTTTDQGEN